MADGKMVMVRYLGQKPKRVSLPVPLVSMSEKEGEVTFNGPGDNRKIGEASAKAMVELMPDLFEIVPDEKPAKSEKAKKDEPAA